MLATREKRWAGRHLYWAGHLEASARQATQMLGWLRESWTERAAVGLAGARLDQVWLAWLLNAGRTEGLG